jgi:hypothetical protein
MLAAKLYSCTPPFNTKRSSENITAKYLDLHCPKREPRT